MKTVRLLLVAPLLLPAVALSAAQPVAAPPEPTLHVEMPPPPETGWTVGDRVPVELVLTTAAGLPTPPRFPAWEETWGEAEIVEVGEVRVRRVAPDTAAGQATYRQRLVLAAFRPGTLPLPPREVAVPATTAEGDTRRVRTRDDLALEISSVLPRPEDGEAAAGQDAGGEGAVAAAPPIPEPRPAQPPREIPVPRAFWLTAVPLAALTALLAWLLWRRRQRVTGLLERPDLPPRDELAHALSAARAGSDPAAALARVSLALRRYLGRRLAFPAAESTSREIRRALRDHHLDTALTRRCDELLAACDLVKFARRPATAGDVERWSGTAEAIADGVERHLRPAEPAEPAAPGTTTREAA